jgi:polyhydroxybutyrate depolymerase
VVNGLTRNYLLHIPPNYQPNVSALVLALHPSRLAGPGMESLSQLSAKADRAGFAVAYPSSENNNSGHSNWDIFYNDLTFTNFPTPPDDVGFLRGLIQTLQANLHPDPKKIYVAGFSSGAFMAHRVGVQLSDLVAAVAAVEGSLHAALAGDNRNVPPALAPVSVLILHGSADSSIPYCGEVSSSSTTASQDETFNYWTGAQANSCSTVNTSAALCVSGQPSSVTLKDATGCRANAEVKIYQLIGGNHQWYNTPMNQAAQVPFNPNLNASTGIVTDDIIWNFFASHPKP